MHNYAGAVNKFPYGTHTAGSMWSGWVLPYIEQDALAQLVTLDQEGTYNANWASASPGYAATTATYSSTNRTYRNVAALRDVHFRVPLPLVDHAEDDQRQQL